MPVPSARMSISPLENAQDRACHRSRACGAHPGIAVGIPDQQIVTVSVTSLPTGCCKIPGTVAATAGDAMASTDTDAPASSAIFDIFIRKFSPMAAGAAS